MILNNEILKKIEKHLIIFVFFLMNQNTTLNKKILKKKISITKFRIIMLCEKTSMMSKNIITIS